MEEQPWYKKAIFYEVYVRAYCDSNGDGQGDLCGLANKLDYLKELGVDCLWLLPTYPSPLKDDGYDIADYCNILTDYGSLEDFKALLEAAHARGLRVITDLVLNHTSDQHPWFQAARLSKDSPYRDFYVWSDTGREYADARIIFIDTETSNWSWDEQAGQYFWHRFYSSQPDLNYANPRVRQAMLDVMRFWLELGVDGFRADAVPYLFERQGTNCENLPETHTYLKELRRYLETNYPGRILLCEANQWPEDVLPYFGSGDEFHLAFNFPVMPRLFIALKKERGEDLRRILDRLPSIPEDCQWCTFLRNHDELTLEMVTPEERQWLWQKYAPELRMRLNLGIRRRLAPLLGNDQRKIELANALLFSLPGSPVIYYGDEIGMGDNLDLPDRNGVRTPMQWEPEPGAGFSSAALERLYAPPLFGEYSPEHVSVAAQRGDQGSLYQAMRRIVAAHKDTPALSLGSFEWVETGNPALAVFRRVWKGQQVLAVHNLSGESQSWEGCPVAGENGHVDLVTGQPAPLSQDRLVLKPYQYLWL